MRIQPSTPRIHACPALDLIRLQKPLGSPSDMPLGPTPRCRRDCTGQPAQVDEKNFMSALSGKNWPAVDASALKQSRAEKQAQLPATYFALTR